MTKLKHLTIGYLLTILLSACGGGGDGGGDSAGNNNNGAGQYDLVDYFFHENLAVTNSTVSYTVSAYSKDTGEQLIQYTDDFEKTADDTIVWTSSGEPASTFVITDSRIDETVHSALDAPRPNQRFVDVGTEYMDATASLPPFGDQNARCTVTAHHDSIDLATKTDAYNLASGIYNDVLEINCITSFIIEGNLAEHTNLNHYFARNIGLVFTEGNLFLFGNVYIIPEI